MIVRELVRKLSEGVDLVMQVATALLAGSFTVLLFVSVVARDVFADPILFSVEISKLLFVWSSFCALTIAYKRKAHIRFEFANQLLGPRGVRLSEVLVRAVSLVFFIVVLIKAVSFTRIVWPTFLPVIMMSQGWLYVSVIVSASVLIIHGFDQLLDAVAEVRK